MDFKEKLTNYAKIATKIGINVQKNQVIVIRTNVDAIDFARLIAKEAYDAGASEVATIISDNYLTRLDYEFMSDDAIEYERKWKLDMMLDYAQRGAGFISISAPNPTLLEGIDPERIARINSNTSKLMKPYMKYTMNDINTWCICAVPSASWAKKVFPDLNEDEGIKELWNLIFKVCKADTKDPIAAWEKQKEYFKEKSELLNKKQYKKLRYVSKKGTDLTIELPKNHIWVGGSSLSKSNIEFIANIPTEEIFTAPKKDGVNGIVYSTKPLNYYGALIEDFYLEFKDGKCINLDAKKNKDVLQNLINTDEGASMLGEVALVPHDSAISNTNKLFYMTLFDENASCHLALGKAYPTNIKGGEDLSDEDLKKSEINDSQIHVDFMIGDESLNIFAYDEENNETLLFENGNWAV